MRYAVHPRAGRLLALSAAAALTGALLPGTAGAGPMPAASAPGQAVFTYTGGPQDWPIPRDVQSVYATLTGGTGGVGSREMAYPPQPPAQPAQVQGTLTWPAGTFALDLWVGGNGGDATGVNPNEPAPGTPGLGGWNGGAAGGSGSEMSSSGGGGGGATDIRIGGYLPDTRVMVAGGGGGQGGIDPGQSDPEGQGLGGAGGTGTASAGVWAGGNGTTAQGDNGGRGGSGGWNPGGQATPGGDAGSATGNGGGGGGGGGWFGGEGGGAGRAGLIGDSGPGGGGGGGSSYAEPGLVTNATAVVAPAGAISQAIINWVDLSATTMPELMVGATVEQQLAAAFPVPNTTLAWAVTGGRLPDGVSLSPAGMLTGVPTQAANYEFTVTVRAQPGNLATSSTTLRGTVVRGGPLPSAPTGATAVAGIASASVSWSAPVYPGTSTLTAYQVRWSSNSGQSWTSPVTVPASVTSYTAGAQGGASYVFQVAAVNSSGAGPWSADSNAVTVTSPSSSPSAVTGTSGYESVALTWSAPTETGGLPLTGYVIRYSTDGGGSWAQLPSTGSTATSFTVTGLTSQAGYIFEVAAINAAGTSPWSAASAVIRPLLDPGAPSDVTGVAGYQSVDLTWLAPPRTAVPVTGYQVRYSDDSGMTWNAPVATGSTATTYIYAGITQPDFLIFQVQALSATGASAWSAPSPPIAPDTRAGAPTRLRASAGDRSATLTWDPPADLGGGVLTGYRVDVRESASTQWRIHTASTGTGATRYVANGLVNGVRYDFRVAAITSTFGTGLFSQSASQTPFGLPGRPRSVQAVSGNARATLTWQAPLDDNGRRISGYRIEAATDTGWYLLEPNTGSPVTTYTAKGLVNGETYLFRVSAITVAGAGADSVPSPPVTPRAAVPSPPRHVAVEVGDARVRVTWRAPRTAGSSPVTGYRVDTSVAGGPWSVQCTASERNCELKGLSGTMPYRFRVAALSAAGRGEWSRPSPPVTPGPDPTRPAVRTVEVRGGHATLHVVSTWLGTDRLQVLDARGRWRNISEGAVRLPRTVEEARLRAYHRGRLSPEIRVTVERPDVKGIDYTVRIDGDRSRISGAPGARLEWRYDDSGPWQAVTSPLTLRTPRPPRLWTLQVRDPAARQGIALGIR